MCPVDSCLQWVEEIGLHDYLHVKYMLLLGGRKTYNECLKQKERCLYAEYVATHMRGQQSFVRSLLPRNFHELLKIKYLYAHTNESTNSMIQFSSHCNF